MARPLIVAHRGARLEAPENTLPAFRLALEQGADGVELDVRLTRDGQAVVLHDATLDRTTDGYGPVSQATLEDLRRLDAGAWFAPAFAGTRLPTLEQALEALSSARWVNVELKGPSGPGERLESQVLRAVERAGTGGRVILSSFGVLQLWHLRRMNRQVALAWLHGPGPVAYLGFLLARALELQALHPFHRAVSERYVRRAQERNLKVVPWTVNDPDEARRLSGWGVTGLITDRPAEMRQWIE